MCIHVTLYEKERHGASHTHTHTKKLLAAVLCLCVSAVSKLVKQVDQTQKLGTEPDMNDMILKKTVSGIFKMLAQHLKAIAE